MNKITVGRAQYHQQDEMIEWCRNNIGTGDWTTLNKGLGPNAQWGVVSMFGYTIFYFPDKKDAVLFALKWPT